MIIILSHQGLEIKSDYRNIDGVDDDSFVNEALILITLSTVKLLYKFIVAR